MIKLKIDVKIPKKIFKKTEEEIPQDSAGLLALIFKLRITNLKLKEQVYTDGLTGLYNYRYFRNQLEREISRAERHDQNLVLLMIDVDNFKFYNDTFGHPKGNEALKKIARIIKNNVRPYDYAVRYGGDEFAVIMPQTDNQEGLTVANRIRKAVEEESLSLTISMGISAFKRDLKHNTDLMNEADIALYKAKDNGKNQLCYN